VKVADIAPPAILTEAGTVASGEVDESVTATPEFGAAPFKVTVPVAPLPPTTGFGAMATVARLAGVIVRVAALLVPIIVAVIVVVIELAVPAVAIENVAVEAPAGTLTDPATVAPAVDDRLTVAPPLGAGRLSMTVPFAELPPTIEVGDTLTPAKSGVSTVSAAVKLILPNVAVTVADTFPVTAVVVIVKFPDVAPAGTVTLAGTAALELFEARLTTVPEDGAGPFKVTVPVEDVPPTTEEGFMVNVARPAGLIVSVAF